MIYGRTADFIGFKNAGMVDGGIISIGGHEILGTGYYHHSELDIALVELRCQAVEKNLDNKYAVISDTIFKNHRRGYGHILFLPWRMGYVNTFT